MIYLQENNSVLIARSHHRSFSNFKIFVKNMENTMPHKMNMMLNSKYLTIMYNSLTNLINKI